MDQYHNVPQPQPRSQQNQFYLHENSPPQVPARRTWAQSSANIEMQQNQVCNANDKWPSNFLTK